MADYQIGQEDRIHGRCHNSRRRGLGTRRAQGNAPGIGARNPLRRRVGRVGRRGIIRHDIGRAVVANFIPADRAAPIPAVVAQGGANRRIIAGVRNTARAVHEHVAAVQNPATANPTVAAAAAGAAAGDGRVPIVVVARDGAARDAAACAAASRAAQVVEYLETRNISCKILINYELISQKQISI